VNSDNNLVYSVFERVIGVESKSYGKKVESVILKKKKFEKWEGTTTKNDEELKEAQPVDSLEIFDTANYL
jgi:hypothetical protein